MRITDYLLPFFLAIGSAGTLTGGTTDPNTPDSKYVEFGTQFPSVARFRAKTKCDKPECKLKEHEQFGSAVIISAHWILTAAHVVYDTSEPMILKDDGTEYALQTVIVHKDYQDDNIGFHDIALGYSPKDFGLKFYTPLYTGHDELGKAITIAGYGIYGTFSTGGKESDGKRRAGRNVIESSERAVLVCTPSSGMTRLPLEFMITPGDSGGGMFIGDKLAGINSFLMAVDKKPDGTYGDEAAFTRMSLYADWVAQQIEKYELAIQARSTTGAEVALADPVEAGKVQP
jgi:hypothetical protein